MSPTDPKNGCAAKHAKLALGIMAVVLTASMTLSAIISAEAKTAAAKLEPGAVERTHAISQLAAEMAGIKATLEAMNQRTVRIENKLDKEKP